MFFNPLYLLLIVPALLGWYAQERVRKIYEKQGAQPIRWRTISFGNSYLPRTAMHGSEIQ